MGIPTLFPSLVSSAFVLALFRLSKSTRPSRVTDSHAVGRLDLTTAMAPGLDLVDRLTASGVLATTLTAGGILATERLGARYAEAGGS